VKACRESAGGRQMFRTQRRTPFGQFVGPAFAYPLLTVVYTLSGKLGLMLAVPPGYASPIFPAAGIAVAAALIRGWATLPWIYLGSLLLNLWTGYSIGHQLDARSVAAATAIAAGSMVQAAIGGSVLRRAIGHPAPLDNVPDLARFLLLSPVCCLTSATLSLGGLSLLGVVSSNDLATSWISWWIGDTLGVLVVLPLILVVAGEPRALWRSRALPVAVPMLLFCALFTAIFVHVSKWEHDEGLLDFRLLSRQVVDQIHTGLEEKEVFLEQLERSFSGPAPVSRSDFHRLAQNLLQRVPTILAVKWAPRVDASQRAAFEAAQQGALPGFEIREIDASRASHRAGTRARFYPVTYVEPLAGNEWAVGLDLASMADRALALKEAIDIGIVAATQPILLAQKHHWQTGMLLIFSVRDGTNGPGVLVIALRMGTFMDELLAPVRAMIGVRLFDLDARRPLFTSASSMPGGARYDQSFDFGGRHYDVETTPTLSYLQQHRRWQSWGVLVAGVFSTGLLGALLMLGTGYTRRVETVVDQRMHDLEATNRRLKVEIREREQAEAALRQAQRMEAIGQLTGGIAHDFNNLLTVVSGNAELLQHNAPNNVALRQASAVVRAAERGKRLTRQLLTFSRRQTLRPEPVDLRQRTREIADMLSRSLRSDIEVIVELPELLWPVAIDPAEFELALLNVGVNARDAMPEGGRFRVAAKNVTFCDGDLENDGLVGEFVAVILSDTGTGMAPDVLTRAFEPYFTTKEAGVGSGLGLSQVHGFAKQSGGSARIASTPGKGTSVKLFLPRASETARVPQPLSQAEPAVGSTLARILVVEDDAEVAEVTAELLQDIGYQPVGARDGKHALATLDRDLTIELVLSDIVMPGEMSGLELARTLRKHRPELPVLLATGYSQYVSPAASEGFVLVEKPYRRDVLRASIQAALERSRRNRIA
jgi:signal transduction histidine kinase/CheY-like chemotaxis protein